MNPTNQNTPQAQPPAEGDSAGTAQPTAEQIRDNAISVAEGTAQPPETPPETPPEPESTSTGEGLDAKKLGLTVARLEKQLREQKAAHDKTRAEYDAVMNRLKDPNEIYGLVEEHGGTYQDWTEKLISGNKEQRDPKDIAIDELKQTVQELAGRLDKRDEGEQQQNQAQAVEKAREYASTYLEDNKEKYPFLHAMGMGDALVQEAMRLNAEGTPVSGEEAEAALAADVEKRHLEAIKGQITNLSKLERFNKLMSEFGYQRTAQTVPEKEPTQQDSQRVSQTNQTLTNDLSGEPTSGFDYSQASPQELRDRAIKVAEHNAANADRGGRHNQ